MLIDRKYVEYPTISERGMRALRHFLLSSSSSASPSEENLALRLLMPRIYPPLRPVTSWRTFPTKCSGRLISTLMNGSSKHGLDSATSCLISYDTHCLKMSGFLLLMLLHLPSTTLILVLTIGYPISVPLIMLS